MEIENLTDSQLAAQMRTAMRPAPGKRRGKSLWKACKEKRVSHSAVYYRLLKSGELDDVRAAQYEQTEAAQ